MNTKREYKIAFNRSKKTYTIRQYDNGKLVAKYRTYPQGEEYSENWTQNDIANYLRYANGDYFIVK